MRPGTSLLASDDGFCDKSKWSQILKAHEKSGSARKKASLDLLKRGASPRCSAEEKTVHLFCKSCAACGRRSQVLNGEKSDFPWWQWGTRKATESQSNGNYRGLLELVAKCDRPVPDTARCFSLYECFFKMEATLFASPRTGIWHQELRGREGGGTHISFRNGHPASLIRP